MNRLLNYPPFLSLSLSLSLHRHLWFRFRRRGRRTASLSSCSSGGCASPDGNRPTEVSTLYLVDSSSSSSTMNAPPPPYVMLSENHGSVRPPPYRRNVPRYHSHNHKSGRSSCFKCICCCYCFLFLLILVFAGLAFYFYSVYQPQKPTYKVEGLDVKAFNVQADFSLNTEFIVTVKADNPNGDIGFIYGRDSSVIVSFNETTLCSGQLPAFHQGHKNTTIMKISLKGNNEFGSGLQEALTENRRSGRIPLLVKVKAPVKIVVGELPLRQFVVLLNCSLVVDNLAPNKKAGIVSSNYKIDVAF